MALTIAYKKIKELIPYCNNSRTHSDEQVLQIASSIKEFGFTNPVLIDGQGGIIAGHGRIMAAQKLKMDEVPTITLSGLSDAQKKAYIIADNKLALNSGWDDELLKIELEQLKELDFDLGLIGFSDDELALLMGGETTEGLVDEDQVPELVDDPVTVLGDIWLLGNHRLMCGDSTSIDAVDKLMDGKKANMIFTDPPYGVSYVGGVIHGNKINTNNKREMLKNDDLDLYSDWLSIVGNYIDSGAIYIFYATRYTLNVVKPLEEFGFDLHAIIAWVKINTGYSDMNSHYKNKYEPCIYAKKSGQSLNFVGPTTENTVWEIKKERDNKLHPTQKPVEVPERAVLNSSKVGDIVADFFGGSGSTLIACEKNNRECFSMELDPKYCDVIINRWQDFTGKQATLESNGKTYNELLNDNQAKNTD
jgi:DNA modification methylase